ncbi:MAG TPA: FAD-binding oxidoreductase [Pseudogracilibacillus sp.]|nr:FAD-binding oxidoreductase [Pseudogracilibacillus sp.]
MKKVVIIGGGIVGAATAYELIQKNIDVTIIDSEKKGRATSAAAGVICPWMTQRRNQAWYTLARNGALYYDSLIKQLKYDGQTNTGYKKVGMIRIDKEKVALEKFADIANERKKSTPEIGDISFLTPEQTKDTFPYLKDDFHGLYIEHAARVDGRALRDALLEASVKRGATYIKDEASLIMRESRIVGAHVVGKDIFADTVIVANGVWMPKVFEEIGIKVDVRAQKGQVIDLIDDTETDELPVVKPPNNQYMLTFDDGKVVIGATQENTNNLLPTSTAYGVHYVLNEAIKYAPSLIDAEMNEIRVGFRPVTFNHAPMFGPLPQHDNVYIATGLGASGLNIGPYIGKQLAKVINEENTDIDLTPFSVEKIVQNH